MLIVAVSRNDLFDTRPNFAASAPHAARAELEPLSADESRMLVEHLVGDAGVAADLPDRVFTGAEGNPLFVEELVRMLVDERHIERDESGVSAVRQIPTFAVPPTIHALLAARLDRLDPGERAVVEAGAVVGRSFAGGARVRAHGRGRPGRARPAPEQARAQAADRARRRSPGRRGHVQLQAHPRPRRRLRGHPQGPAQRPARPLRRLGRARGRRARRRVRRDPRLPLRARLPLPGRAGPGRRPGPGHRRARGGPARLLRAPARSRAETSARRSTCSSAPCRCCPRKTPPGAT